MILHPSPGENGKPVSIEAPSTPTSLFAWVDPSQTATVVPGGAMPQDLNGVPFRSWRLPPSRRLEWDLLAEEMVFIEPFDDRHGDMTPAAGAVVVEPDGRVWLVSPTNQHGGAQQTFPKGTVTDLSPAATAMKEVFEKTGLRIEILDHLMDAVRTTSKTRYFLARRIGGTPSAMGWRSQAVHLVPLELVKERLNLPVDHPIVDRLMEVWGAWAGRFREPLERPSSRAIRQVREIPQAVPPHQEGDAAAKYLKQDADAIAALACAGFTASKDEEAIQHCKHAAVVLHHQGKTGLAKLIARFVNQTKANVDNLSSPPPPPQTEPVPVPTPRIRRVWMSKNFLIFESQARFIAHLIQDLDRACMRAYHLQSIREVRFEFGMTPEPWDLPEYTRFITGCMASGFVCGDIGVDDWLDLASINREPESSIARMTAYDLRLYLHTLHRAEKWGDCLASPILDAFASGALPALAQRFLEDESLYETD